jgi:serine/threonine-protein kinase HipA
MAAITTCTVFDCTDVSAPVPVGVFALDHHGDGHFGYGLKYIQRPSAFALDPLHLPLSANTHFVRRRKDGSFGVLSDAGPNAWGTKLTSSIFRKMGRALPTTPVEWFLKSWHYGSGCIGFSDHHTNPPNHGVRPVSVAELDARVIAVIEALAVDPDKELDPEAIRLALPGGSLGGVRPKTVVIHDGWEHIAKFSRLDDRFDVPAAEYATMRLAHMAGINVPEFELIRIGGRTVLLVERFDRTADGKRLHYMSANSLIDIDTVSHDGREYKAGYSYAGIAEAMRPLNDHGLADSHELFRRMVFNILVGNVDDHMRNHALLMSRTGRFALSPAFDIVPHLDAVTTPQSIGVGASGPASTIANALSQCGRFLLKESEARAVVEQVREAVAQWKTVFREADISETDIHTLAGCFSAADSAERLVIPVDKQESLE